MLHNSTKYNEILKFRKILPPKLTASVERNPERLPLPYLISKVVPFFLYVDERLSPIDIVVKKKNNNLNHRPN